MKRIDFASPESSAAYLIGGFSAVTESSRMLSQVARMRLFLPEGAPNRLVLRVRYDRPQRVTLRLNGHELGTRDIQADAQPQELCVDVPAEAARSESVLELVCEQPHPLDRHVPRCLHVLTLDVAEWDQPAAPEPEASKEKVFFGDIHVHSNISPCGRPNNGTLDENYEWAREDGWDFVAIADHDTFMSEQMWRESIQACERYNDPGRFATIFAYEWTSFFYGQMNAYSPSPELPLLRCTDPGAESPPRLWAALRETGLPVFTIAHHMAAAGWATTWDYHDPEMRPLIEVYSVWRSSETPEGWSTKGRPKLPGCTARDALARGLRVGFIGGGDTHQFRPGERGIAAVPAPECTREAIWNALRAKRCYATTGARIELSFSVGGVGMGGQRTFTPYTLDTLYPCPVDLHVKGTAPIRRIELIDNGEVIYDQPDNYGLREVTVDFKLEHPVRRFCPTSLSVPSRAIYARVTQEDGHIAWSSPVYLVRDYRGIE